MANRNLMRMMAGSAVLALSLAGIAPATAHEGKGDVPTNERGARRWRPTARASGCASSRTCSTTSPARRRTAPTSSSSGSATASYALAGTLRGGMQIIDITRSAVTAPGRGLRLQGHPGRHPGLAHQRPGAGELHRGRHRRGGRRGVAVRPATSTSRPADAGTVIVDITSPRSPQTVSFLPVPRGSHNMTIHPSGDYLYNSNSDLISSTEPTITIYDISQPAEPEEGAGLPDPVRARVAGLGVARHHVQQVGHARLRRGPVADPDPRHHRPAKLRRQVSQIVDPTINVVAPVRPRDP